MDIFYELEWNFQTLSSVSKCRVDEVKLKISLASGSVFNSNLALQKERVPHLLIGFVLWYRFNLAPRKAHFFQRKTRTRIPVFAIQKAIGQWRREAKHKESRLVVLQTPGSKAADRLDTLWLPCLNLRSPSYLWSGLRTRIPLFFEFSSFNTELAYHSNTTGTIRFYQKDGRERFWQRGSRIWRRLGKRGNRINPNFYLIVTTFGVLITPLSIGVYFWDSLSSPTSWIHIHIE